MKLRNALFSLGAAAMLAAPVVAQAGTTASASASAFGSASVHKFGRLSSAGQRKSAAIARGQNAESGTILLAGLGAVALGVGIYAIVDDGNKSNGS